VGKTGKNGKAGFLLKVGLCFKGTHKRSQKIIF